MRRRRRRRRLFLCTVIIIDVVERKRERRERGTRTLALCHSHAKTLLHVTHMLILLYLARNKLLLLLLLLNDGLRGPTGWFLLLAFLDLFQSSKFSSPLQLLDRDPSQLAPIIHQPIRRLRSSRHVRRQPFHFKPFPP